MPANYTDTVKVFSKLLLIIGCFGHVVATLPALAEIPQTLQQVPSQASKMASTELEISHPVTSLQESQPTGISQETPDSAEVSVGILRAGLQKTQLKTLDLEEALKIALEQNPTLKAETANTKQAKARYLGSLADFLPDVGVSYTIARYDGAVQGLKNHSSFIPMKRDTVAPQLYFRFNLLQGGAQIFLARYAKRTLEAQQLTEQATVQEILHETAIRYYELERRLADLNAAQLQLNEAQEDLALIQSPQGSQANQQTTLATDDKNELAALQLESQLTEARTRLIEAESASEQAALSLNELLALPAFIEPLPQTQPSFHTLIPLDMDFQACLTQAQAGNLPLKARQKELAALQQLLKGATVTGILPEVNTDFNMGSVGASRDELGRYQSHTVKVGFISRNMGMDSLTRFKEIKARMAGLKSQIAEEQNALQRTVSEAQLNGRTRQAQLAMIRHRLVLTQKARQQALAAIQDRPSHTLDLLQAQTMLNQARYQLNENIMAYNKAQADLIFAMGAVSVDTLAHGLPSTSTQVSSNQH